MWTPSILAQQNAWLLRLKSVDDWFRLAPPKKGRKQWKDSRSAKELTRAWFATGQSEVPGEVIGLFNSHDASRRLETHSGIPEAGARLDSFKGKSRHHDLTLFGQACGVRRPF